MRSITRKRIFGGNGRTGRKEWKGAKEKKRAKRKKREESEELLSSAISQCVILPSHPGWLRHCHLIILTFITGYRSLYRQSFLPVLLQPYSCAQGRFYVRAGGALTPPPDSLVAPRLKSYSSPFWRDFWGPKMLQIFRSSAPDPAGELTMPPGPLTDGRGSLPPCQEPHPRCRPFGPRFYGSQGLTHYRGNPTNDRFRT